MNITIGWWAVPALVTAVAFGWNWWIYRNDEPASGYGRIGDALARGMTFAVALVVSLVAWLIWAVLT